MLNNNINEIINNSLNIDKSRLLSIKEELITSIKEAIMINKDAFDLASRIDIKNNNGNKLDFAIIEDLFNDKTIPTNNDAIIINDGNTYHIIKLIIQNILKGNTVIFVNKGYMYGVNTLLIQIVQTVLEINNINKNLIQIYITDDINNIPNNNFEIINYLMN